MLQVGRRSRATAGAAGPDVWDVAARGEATPELAEALFGRFAAGACTGTNGVSTHGVTAHFMFLVRGTFWVLPLTYFYLPKSARAYLFPQSVKIIYLRGDPISVDPICPQPHNTRLTSMYSLCVFHVHVA